MEQNQNTTSPRPPSRPSTNRSKGPQGRPPARSDAPEGRVSEETAPASAGAQTKKRAPHGSLNGPKGKPPAPRPDTPAFEVVPRKYRHDGWTPERQRAFISALADTGVVTRAARRVNMAPESAYHLRNQPGAEGFRAAWEAALDLGVRRLKDEVFERALEGQLQPVIIGGKLKGFRRVKSDRMLMFALRMNAKDEYGRRLAATYFDPNAPRLHAGTGKSSRNEVIGQYETPDGTALLEQSPAFRPMPDPNPRPARVTETITGPAVSQADKDARAAALVAGFDPVAMTLPEIEAMQTMLAKIAAQRRAEMAGNPEHDTTLAFLENRDGEFKPVGPFQDVYPVVTEDDREPEFDEGEVPWWELGDPEGGA